MSSEEQAREPDYNSGPLSVLNQCANKKSQVMISGRNNKKIVGNLLAFDKHCNMVLINVKEMWTEFPRLGKGKKKGKPLYKDRTINKLFIRGDTVISVLPNPGNEVE